MKNIDSDFRMTERERERERGGGGVRREGGMDP